jgi:hypothetical protein
MKPQVNYGKVRRITQRKDKNKIKFPKDKKKINKCCIEKILKSLNDNKKASDDFINALEIS